MLNFSVLRTFPCITRNFQTNNIMYIYIHISHDSLFSYEIISIYLKLPCDYVMMAPKSKDAINDFQ